MSIEDLQAFIVLRGSTLGPDDKKRVILEGDQASSRKLTIKKVGESIRLLGASFFMDVTSQKKMKTKVYGQIALTVEEAQEPAENFLSEDMTEEEYIEALIAEGEDDDAALIADFESSASELIQEDTEVAQAFTAYQDSSLHDRWCWPIQVWPRLTPIPKHVSLICAGQETSSAP